MKSLKEFFFSKKKRNARQESEVSSKEPKEHDREVFKSEFLFSQNPNDDFFSHPDMKDLAQVGITKSLGYLPFDMICKAKFDSFTVTLLLQERGLKVFSIPVPVPEKIYAYNPNKKKYIRIADDTEYDVIPKGSFMSIRSGALVAYDEKAVNEFLKQYEELINEENGKEPNLNHHWPLEAKEFVNMLFRKQAESPKMEKLISKIYTEMPNQSDLSHTLKSRG